MPLQKLMFKPGINREGTNYSNTGGWWDCDKVRFRDGFPEKIGGWVKFLSSTFLGSARSLHPWSTINGNRLYGLGTNLKLYVIEGDVPTDITPIRRDVTLGTDPFTTDAAGSNVVTVADTAHGAATDDFVIYSGATGPIDGIPASEFNTEHQIDEVVDANSYKISPTTNATAGSVSGGGSSVDAEYQINVGTDSSLFGLGFGADGFGEGGYGDAGVAAVQSQNLRLWHMDNFGEDLVANVRDSAIYYFDASAGIASTNRAQQLDTLGGAVDVPTICRQAMVSNNDRHVIAFGCNDIGSGDQDLLIIRWSDQEDALNWEQLTTTTAGTMRLNTGSEIIVAREVSNEILVWTDSSLHSMRYLGPPYIFGQRVVGANVTIIAPNAVVTIGDLTIWWGQDQFYMYNGRVLPLHCSVEKYVFGRVDAGQRNKITAGLNRKDGEAIFLYPSVDGTGEIDSYVIYNYHQQIWYYGSLTRTVWIDQYFDVFPIAAGDDGELYFHENGCDDGSTDPVTAINAYVESSDFEIADGYRFSFIRRLFPDVTFDGSDAASPSVTVTVTPREFLGQTYDTGDAPTITRTATVPVEQFDEQKHIRVRGREIKYRVESNDVGVFWRQGIPRIDTRPDGRR
jgi:hypothetical protein